MANFVITFLTDVHLWRYTPRFIKDSYVLQRGKTEKKFFSGIEVDIEQVPRCARKAERLRLQFVLMAFLCEPMAGNYLRTCSIAAGASYDAACTMVCKPYNKTEVWFSCGVTPQSCLNLEFCLQFPKSNTESPFCNHNAMIFVIWRRLRNTACAACR